jgi:glycosyltransferase involved in cell wall biosynthesis
MRIGYAPYDHSLQAPGDRKRFVAWAEDRQAPFEVVDAPRAGIDVAVVCTVADLTRWRNAPRSAKIVYDITDDYLALPEAGLKNRARGVVKFLSGELSRPTLRYGRLMAEMCRRADVVVCTSEDQRRRVRDLGHRDVRIILDCYDAESMGIKRDYRGSGQSTLAWEGLPFNVDTLELLRDPIAALPPALQPTVHVATQPTFHPYARRFGRRSAQTIAQRALPNVPIVVHAWNRTTIPRIVAACDVAVIPLPLEDPFARSKSAQKLVGLWAMGMPVVTSATPAYTDAMEAAGLDFACTTTDDWERALTALLSDEQARRDAGAAGQAYVAAHASREIMLTRWDEVLGWNGREWP